MVRSSEQLCNVMKAGHVTVRHNALWDIVYKLDWSVVLRSREQSWYFIVQQFDKVSVH